MEQKQEWHHVATIEDLGNLNKKINITYDSEAVEMAFKKATNIIRKGSRIKGFRQGRAPVQLVKNTYMKEIRKSASSLLESEGYLHACFENKLQPLGDPDIKFSQFNVDGTFSCEMVVEVKPTIEPTGYIGLQLTKQNINKEEIRDQLENEQRTEHMKQVPTDKVELGSFVEVDYIVNCEGAQISNGEGQTFIVSEGREPPFGENLVGKVVGERFTENITLPEQIEDGGKSAEVDITIKNIFRKVLPTNEELVESMKAPSYEELMEAFDKRAEYIAKEKENQAIEEEIITKLLELHKFDVPIGWVEDEEKYLSSQLGINLEDENIKKYIKEMAERNVKRTFILEAIYDAEENLKVEKEEFDAWVEREASKRQVSSSTLLGDLKKNNMLDGVFGMIKHRKVLNFIISQANVVDSIVENNKVEIPENPLIEV